MVAVGGRNCATVGSCTKPTGRVAKGGVTIDLGGRKVAAVDGGVAPRKAPAGGVHAKIDGLADSVRWLK